MTRKSMAALSVFVISAVGLLRVLAADPQTQTPDSDQAQAKEKALPVDVTQKMRQYNSGKFATPPTEFRKGHTTGRKFDAKATVKTEAGFVVKLPSGAPIPTPTVYDGKVYVSGGFHSKEFYCFDAVTGELVWAIDLDDDGPSSAVCSDGICVFNTESCTIFAVNALTGSHIWSHWLGDPLTSTPAIAGGRVFTSYPADGGGGGGGLQQLNGALQNTIPNNNAPEQANQTEQLQQAEPQAQTADVQEPDESDDTPEPADAKDKADDGKKRPPMSHVLACLDLKTGEILWQKWIDSDVMSSPVCVDDEVYITTFAGTVMKLDQATGKIKSAMRQRATSAPVIVGKDVLFTQRADTGNGASPAEERLAFNDRQANTTRTAVNKKVAKYLDKSVQSQTELNAKGQKLDAGNGFSGGAPQAANPAAALGNIGYANVSTMQAFQGSRGCVFGDSTITCPGDEIIANDNRTGKVRWKIKLEGDLEKVGGFLAAPPAAAGNQLFISTLDGHVLQLDPDSGKLAKKHKIGSPIRFQPAIVDGRIYVGTQDGKLVAVDTKNRKLTGWTTWGGDAAHTGVYKTAQSPSK